MVSELKLYWITALRSWLIAALLLFNTGCAVTAPYDQYVYQSSTSMKVDALNLMSNATEPYSKHLTAIEQFTDQLNKLYEYELHRKKNDIRIRMWNLLKDPERNLLGGFMKRWQQEGRLSAPFVEEAKIIIGKSFDQLAELESGKLLPKDIQQ